MEQGSCGQLRDLTKKASEQLIKGAETLKRLEDLIALGTKLKEMGIPPVESSFKWAKLRWPLVTECCASLNFANALSSGCTICCKCDCAASLRLATAEDMQKNGINYTAQQMEEAYERRIH